MPTALADSSFLIAVANASDAHHGVALTAAEQAGAIVTPVTILAETMSFLRARLGVEKQRRFWEAFERSGVEVIPVGVELLEAAREIDSLYADAHFGFAAAVLLATCEHVKCARLLTFDRRLGLYRPSFAGHLELLPG